VRTVSLSRDGKYTVSGSFDKTLMVWDVTSGKAVRTLEGHSEAVNAVIFSGDAGIIASGSNDKTIILWKVEIVEEPPEPPAEAGAAEPPVEAQVTETLGEEIPETPEEAPPAELPDETKPMPE
jgi:hypothetical protein